MNSPCAGRLIIDDCERHEDRLGMQDEVYRRLYDSVPVRWRESLLVVSVGEIAQGETLDTQIIDCYDQAEQDDAELGRLLRLLLDKQRKVIAERETDEELFGVPDKGPLYEEMRCIYQKRFPWWVRAWRHIKYVYTTGWSMP